MGPRSAAAERVFAAVGDSFRRHGGNPNVGMDVPRHMHAAGLQVRSVHPLVRVGRPGRALWEWPRPFFQIFLPTLVAEGELSAAEHAAFWEDYDARSADPAAFFMSPPMVEVIGVRPA